MRRTVLAFVAIGALAAALHAQQPLRFFASVTDATGLPVPDLTEEDFQVKENGVAGKVLKVERIDWPVKVQLLVDTGAGIGGDNLIHVRNGVRGLLEALPGGVEVTVVATAPPRALLKPTTDRDAILKLPGMLAPDSGAGRFIDALSEAAERAEKDKSNHFPVIVALGSTAAGGSNVTDSRAEQLMKRLAARAATVHVVMFSSNTQGELSGSNAVIVGTAVTQLTGGRYESILTASRIATLLPEIGQQIAASHLLQSQQYRVTFERPSGSSPLGNVTLGAREGMRARLSLDGHLP